MDKEIKKKLFEDLKTITTDKAICIRCFGQMYKLPVPIQPGVDQTIITHACTECGKMEFFMDLKSMGEVLK